MFPQTVPLYKYLSARVGIINLIPIQEILEVPVPHYNVHPTDLSRYVNHIAYKYSCRWSCYGLMYILRQFHQHKHHNHSYFIWCMGLTLTIRDAELSLRSINISAESQLYAPMWNLLPLAFIWSMLSRK